MKYRPVLPINSNMSQSPMKDIRNIEIYAPSVVELKKFQSFLIKHMISIFIFESLTSKCSYKF